MRNICLIFASAKETRQTLAQAVNKKQKASMTAFYEVFGLR